MSRDEAVATYYFQTHLKMVNREKVFVPTKWLSKPKYVQDEHFLSTFELNPADPQGNI